MLKNDIKTSYKIGLDFLSSNSDLQEKQKRVESSFLEPHLSKNEMTAIIIQSSTEIVEFLRGKLKKRVFRQYACNYDIDLNGNYALRKCLCCFNLLEREVDVGL